MLAATPGSRHDDTIQMKVRTVRGGLSRDGGRIAAACTGLPFRTRDVIEFSNSSTLSSPWAYFAGPKLQVIFPRHRARLMFKPFAFQALVRKTGGIPLLTR